VCVEGDIEITQEDDPSFLKVASAICVLHGLHLARVPIMCCICVLF
jgi:hypothetical protein